MSNRPTRKRSRSAAARPVAPPSADRRRVWLIVAGVAGVVLIALATALWVGRSQSASEPQLDAQAATGKRVATEKGCLSCHSTTGNRSEGPTWKGMYGKPVALTTGATVTADDAYLTRAIREPGAQIVAGYRAGMPTTALNDDELAAVLAYLHALA